MFKKSYTFASAFCLAHREKCQKSVTIQEWTWLRIIVNLPIWFDWPAQMNNFQLTTWGYSLTLHKRRHQVLFSFFFNLSANELPRGQVYFSNWTLYWCSSTTYLIPNVTCTRPIESAAIATARGRVYTAKDDLRVMWRLTACELWVFLHAHSVRSISVVVSVEIYFSDRGAWCWK